MYFEMGGLHKLGMIVANSCGSPGKQAYYYVFFETIDFSSFPISNLVLFRILPTKIGGFAYRWNVRIPFSAGEPTPP